MPAQVEQSTGFLATVSSYVGMDSKAGDPSSDPFADNLLDLLEGGFARESVIHECLKTQDQTDGFNRFTFKRIGKKHMDLYVDGGERFMLSARRVGDDFFISPYKMDAKETGEPKRRCAVLRKRDMGKGSAYTLYLDKDFGRDNQHIYENVVDKYQEEVVLAHVTHATAVLEEADMLMRTLKVTLPVILASDNWDVSQPAESLQKPVQLVTKLPKWVASSGCLTQKFHGNRVKASSAKNFILTQDKFEERSDQKIAMQFGKKGRKTYIMDHTAPLSPLQAFGICLSMCNWIGD
jgi:hypothetical protein